MFLSYPSLRYPENPILVSVQLLAFLVSIPIQLLPQIQQMTLVPCSQKKKRAEAENSLKVPLAIQKPSYMATILTYICYWKGCPSSFPKHSMFPQAHQASHQQFFYWLFPFGLRTCPSVFHLKRKNVPSILSPLYMVL